MVCAIVSSVDPPSEAEEEVTYLENVSSDQRSLEFERQRVYQVVKNLQRDLKGSNKEVVQWKEMFHAIKEDRRKIKEEVLQLKLEKEARQDGVSGREQILERLRKQLNQELCDSKKECGERSRELQQIKQSLRRLWEPVRCT
ncbi:cingulin-like [Phyllobates terribilis]|uniref:cingulin-like n=1 Tax=Phyllobates terribilis TaxID=111132 RepID=UPI003CCAC8AA